MGLAAAFAFMTIALAVAGILYNLAILAPAALFGTVTYILWAHGTGRLAARIYRGVEGRAAVNGGRAGFRQPGDRSDGRDRASAEHTRRRATNGGGRRTASRSADRREAGGGASRFRETPGPEPGTGPSMAPSDARDILAVASNADQATIRAAYRDRVKAVHPDADDGDTDQFKRVQEAYETLKE